jgi:hypothetical protein
MIQHMKHKRISTNVEIGNPILGYGGKIVIHNITKDLKMFKLITSHKIIIHHEEINLTFYFFVATKSWMKTSFPWENLIKELIDSNNINK